MGAAGRSQDVDNIAHQSLGEERRKHQANTLLAESTGIFGAGSFTTGNSYQSA